MENISHAVLDLFGLKPNDFFISKKIPLFHKNKMFGDISLNGGHYKFHFEPPNQTVESAHER
jgi:hypothetical protein